MKSKKINVNETDKHKYSEGWVRQREVNSPRKGKKSVPPTLEDIYCDCGNPKLPESDFCKDCI